MSARSRLLKGAAPTAPRLLPAAVHAADRRASETIARADEEARAIVAAAEAARDRCHAEAAEEGRREGLARAAAALAAAGRERDRHLALARKVLGRELAAADAVVDLAARALEEARARREVILRVNPSDAPALRASEERLGRILLRAPLALREDPAVPRGGAVVETEAGSIDASVETQLAALARALEDGAR